MYLITATEYLQLNIILIIRSLLITLIFCFLFFLNKNFIKISKTCLANMFSFFLIIRNKFSKVERTKNSCFQNFFKQKHQNPAKFVMSCLYLYTFSIFALYISSFFSLSLLVTNYHLYFLFLKTNNK